MQQERINSIVNEDLLDNYFILRKSEIVKGGRVIEVDFTPLPSKTSNTIIKVLPIFNKDKKQHMPSFIIPYDMENIQEHQKIYVTLHQKKLIEASEEKDQLFLPKPSKKNSCCCICRTLYDDYLTHLTSPNHQALMQKSQFNDDIYELCLQFSLFKRTQSTQTQVGEQTNEKPRKKVKTETKRKTTKRHPQSGVSNMIDSTAFPNPRIVAEPIV